MNLIVLVLCFLYVNGSIVYTAFDMEGNSDAAEQLAAIQVKHAVRARVSASICCRGS
eukprot:COSAG05_NODE_10273_length_574_cov_0.743158_1_plen_56_part_10